jgi:hypothetical protein
MCAPLLHLHMATQPDVSALTNNILGNQTQHRQILSCRADQSAYLPKQALSQEVYHIKLVIVMQARW